MGYLTTFTISNDRIHEFLSNPEKLAKTLEEGMNRANDTGEQVSLEGNYIKVQPSRHADDETVYVHTGNTVFNLNPWNRDFKFLAKRNKELAKDFVRRAQVILTGAKRYLKSEK